MKILNDDYSVVKNDLEKCLNVLKNSNNTYDLISAYIGLMDFYEDIQLKKELKKYLPELNRITEDKKTKLIREEISKNINDSFKNTGIDEKYYLSIMKELYSTINKNIDLNKKIDLTYSILDDETIYRTLYCYFMENDYKLLELLNKYKDNKTLLKGILPYGKGITSASNIFDNIYIKIKETSDFGEMISILHELSHARYFEEFIRDSDNKNYTSFICQNLFCEVYPRLQEKMFLRFLIHNNIFVEDVYKYSIKSYIFYGNLLRHNIDTYLTKEKFDFLDVKDINSFILRDVLFYNNYIPNSRDKIFNTSDLKDYFNKYETLDIIKTIENTGKEIKMLKK